MTGRRLVSPREALLAVPLLGIVGVLAAEFSAHSAVVTIGSLAISGSAIGFYLFLEWGWPRDGGSPADKSRAGEDAMRGEGRWTDRSP